MYAVLTFIFERGYPIGYLMSGDHEIFSTTKWWLHHHVLLMKLFKSPLFFSKCGKGKMKEMYRFRKEVLGVLPPGFGKSLIS